MKIKKVVDICKRSGQITLLNDEDMQWLGDGVAFYPLMDAPLFDEDSLVATFDITEKQKESILFRTEFNLPEGFCFENNCDGETFAERNDIILNYKGEDFHVFHSSRGALYIKAKYLSPLNKEELEIYQRQTKGGIPYFVCKTGFMVQALIMPVMLDTKVKAFAEALDLLYEQSLKSREDKDNE